MRKLMLLLAAGSLWLFLAAVPVFADGGPHVSSANSGVSTLAADGCAGCHRAHTAQGEMLINAPTEEELCLTCHGAASTGATTDVMTGIQYAVAANGLRGAAPLGALRGGGFDQARIDAGSMTRLAYYRNAAGDISQRPKVAVGAAEDVTSAHISMTANGLTLPNVAWGNGIAGSGAGPAADVSCGSCHNPHGNGNFRILQNMPEATGISDVWEFDVLATVATGNRVYTEISHALQNGDVVTVTGTGTAADGVGRFVVGVAANYFSVATTVGGTAIVLTDATPVGATVERTSGVNVTDAALAPAGDTRNYTVMQVKGTAGTPTSYLLYASQVATAAGTGTFNGIAGNYTATGGDYFARNVPWNPQVNNAACVPTVDATTLPAACATAASAPNGIAATFSGQITAWCASCHTRYFANNVPNDATADPLDTVAAWAGERPGDSLYKTQHRTVPGRDCMTCHVSHGSNAAMTGTFSASFPYPNATVSASSRLLKVDNRGTCQACHDPTETVAAGTLLPTGATVSVP